MVFRSFKEEGMHPSTSASGARLHVIGDVTFEPSLAGRNDRAVATP
ncbi:MAG: hypothetical protein KDA86_18405 [Planctomycetaceae bacterium]|nr:hypothetical protein [Planctomycetaceae bacterium]